MRMQLSMPVLILMSCSSVGNAQNETLSTAELNQQLVRVQTLTQSHLQAGELEQAFEQGLHMLELQRQIVELTQQAPTSTAQQLDSARLQLAGTLEWVAQQQELQQKFVPAVATRTELLKLVVELLGSDHWQVVDTRLALATAQKRSELPIEARQKLDLANQLSQSGIELQSQQRFDDAIECFEKCVSLREEILGEQNRQTASALSWLGNLYWVTGRYAQAETLYQKSLAINTSVLGLEHPTTVTCMNLLAVLYKDLGDYAKAAPLYEQCVKTRTKLFGLENTSTAESINNRAVLQMWTSQYGASARGFQEGLRITQKLLGDEHEDTATCLHNLALLYTMTGDYSKAEPMYKQALEIDKRRLGVENLTTCQIQSSLGLLYLAQDDFQHAEPLFESSLHTAATIAGPEHPTTIAIRDDLALLYQSMGEWDKAKKLYGENLEFRAKQLGASNATTATSHHNLGRIAQQQNDFAVAEEEYATALSIQQNALGKMHIETAASFNSLGLLKLAMGQDDQAQDLIAQALSIYRQLLDETAIAQTERQQLIMNQRLRSSLDDWLSANPTESAYAEVLRWKGSIFVRQAALRTVRSQPELSSLVEELRSNASRLAKLALDTSQSEQSPTRVEQLQLLSQEHSRLELELANNSQEYGSSRGIATLSLASLQERLPADVALVDLLEYERVVVPGKNAGNLQRERRFVAFVVRSDRQPVRIELGSADAMDSLVDRYRLQLQDKYGENAVVSPAARELRRMLWEPLEPSLDEITTLLISPDGSLGKLPFAALPGSEPESYLLEDYILAVMPVPQNLGQPSPKKASASMLIAGGIDYQSLTDEADDVEVVGTDRAGPLKQWTALDRTESEGLFIREKFNENYPKVTSLFLKGKQATEEEIRRLAPLFGVN